MEAVEEERVRNWWNCECEKRLVEVRLLVKKVELKDLSPESQRRFVACNSAAYLANSKTNVYSRQQRRKTLCTLLLFLQSSHTQPPRIVKYTSKVKERDSDAGTITIWDKANVFSLLPAQTCLLNTRFWENSTQFYGTTAIAVGQRVQFFFGFCPFPLCSVCSTLYTSKRHDVVT